MWQYLGFLTFWYVVYFVLKQNICEIHRLSNSNRTTCTFDLIDVRVSAFVLFTQSMYFIFKTKTFYSYLYKFDKVFLKNI